MGEPKPQIIVIAGPNGAGKSTLAPFLLRDTFGLTEYVNADTIAQGLSAFKPEGAAFEAGRIMLRRLHHLADERRNFAFESTLASRSYAGWISELRKQGYEFHLIYLWLSSVNLAVERVRERVSMGGHSVPEGVIRRRYVKGVRNFLELYEPLADTWGVYDNSDAGTALQIAIMNKSVGTKVIEESLWRKFREVAK
ncbi:MAG: zeta toxin family protein [Pyrinomonadaceae bacterium]|nr:zeta toxin family protein [Pyrinomonadaceae bacterium]